MVLHLATYNNGITAKKIRQLSTKYNKEKSRSGGRYPGPRGFLLFFIGKFCDANRLFYLFIFFCWHEALIDQEHFQMK